MAGAARLNHLTAVSFPRLMSFTCWLLLWSGGGLALAQSSRAGWGSTPYHTNGAYGVTFRVWAPDATSVYVPGQFNNWSTTATALMKELTNGVWNGNWSADVSSATNGQQYKYYLNFPGGNNYISGTSVWRHDPRARKVVSSSTGSGGNDIIYDPTLFNWTNDVPIAPSLNDLVIYELHIGTFYNPNSNPGSVQGTFLNATNRLDYLKSLGVSAVEVLPIAEFPGATSWGYNPADIFAADNNSYGGPDGFKTFVKACHARGIAVLLDVVHNHYGPTDLDLWDFDGWTGTNAGGGIYFYQDPTISSTPWGSRPNYTRQQTRDFIQQNIQMWLEECHVDGFRWDATSAMTNNNGIYIPDGATLLTNINTFIHTNYSGKVSIAEDIYNNLGFDGAWDTDYPYAVTPVLTNAVDANRNLNIIAYALADAVRYGGNAGMNRVTFLESHDVVGDLNNGTRVVTAIDPTTPNSWRARKLSLLGAALTFCSPGVPMLFQGQEMLENQPFSTSRPVDWSKTNTYSGIVNCYRDMIRLRRNIEGYSAGLKGDSFAIVAKDDGNKVIVTRRWQANATNSDCVVVANLSSNVLANYTVPFPATGNWYLHFNSDATNYSSDFTGVGSNTVSVTGATANIALGAYAVEVFSQQPFAPTMSIAQSNRVTTIAWPVNFANWTLQSATSLGGNWTTVNSISLQTNSGSISLAVPSSGAVFYRLQRP
jgi:1,4-alpha-glucan branching enzyme